MEVKKPTMPVLAYEKNYMRGRRVLFRLWKRVTGNERPSSYPYVTGDSFRALADHIHDETSLIDPGKVMIGDVVFVSNPFLLSYLKNVHPRIKFPYVLIEHNGDENVDKEITDLLDEKIVRFYAQDVVAYHPKITPIPLALENLHIYVNGMTRDLNRLERRIRKNPPIRKNRIFFQFSIGTNPAERGPALEYFSKHPCMETVKYFLPPRIHWKKLSTYKFVASPPGHAIESCRTWEAMHMRTVPIIKDFPPSRYFAEIGLPVWVLKDWKELEEYDDKKLADKYEEFMKNANWEPLYMDFWIKMIRADQEKARLNISL